MSAQIFSSRRIAELVASRPETALIPTHEQSKVIEQPLGESVLVIAGAGSGKTETMANRVVWLVANGLASPREILGLTFTRKAAGELNERVARGLATFTDRLIDARERNLLTQEESNRSADLESILTDGLDLPTVSTYNSFAAGIVQEFGALAGVVSTATLIDEAAAWRIARDVVCQSTDTSLIASPQSIASLVKLVLALDHAVSDNLSSFDKVEKVIHDFHRVRHLPYSEKIATTGAEGKLWAVVRDALDATTDTLMVNRLAREYAQEKRRLDVIEFSDQLRLAFETTESFAPVISLSRERSPIVLLDEVQDTSVGQTRLLSRLFRGQSVMAVGDPNQSIYGWRGASANNLSSFYNDFADTKPSQFHESLSLSVSWRNPATILQAANVIAAPLNESSPFSVPKLQARARPECDIPPTEIEALFPETVDEEYAAIAGWVRDARAEHLTRTGAQATAAVIFRSRASMPAVSAALNAVGVPNRIVGVGGLLGTPEVTDLVCALRCVWYADAGSELIRLLVGPRFAVGVADIAGLNECARWFSRRDAAWQVLPQEDRKSAGGLVDADSEFSVLDALDEIVNIQDSSHAALVQITEEGLTRLREAGTVLRQLRHSVAAGVQELLRMTVEALRLDIELDANESHGFAGSAVARANIDAFSNLVEGFMRTDAHGTLSSVLAWIERVSELDQVAEHVPEPEPGTVQLITGHGSKGLEWDLVVVPRMVANEFPVSSRTGLGWLRTGEIPDELRGDASARPHLNWRIAMTQEDLREAIGGYSKKVQGETIPVEGYKDRLAANQQEEERRLAYVVITRSASRLLLTGSYWAGHTSAREPSPYLIELAEAGVLAPIPLTSAYESDPTVRDERTMQWPLDPLGARRTPVRRAAELVRERIDQIACVANGDIGEERVGDVSAGDAEIADINVDPVVQLLIAERHANRVAFGGENQSMSVQRITASTFHEFIEDPDAVERRTLRPLPQQPFRRTRTGNLFHEWVERRATTEKGTAVALFDDGPGGSHIEPPAADEVRELDHLIDCFHRSRWATLQPIAVEQEITLPFAGQSLVCKLDAVFEHNPSAEHRFEIVDWKTGKPPRNEAEKESRLFQLDLYRHAYALWRGIDPSRISASLYYVADEVEIQNATPRSLEELERMWISAREKLTAQSLGS